VILKYSKIIFFIYLQTSLVICQSILHHYFFEATVLIYNNV